MKSNENENQKKSPHYVSSVEYEGLLHISGQLPIDPETDKKILGGFKAEANQALDNMLKILKEANLDKKDVIKCRVYLSDIEYWAEFNEIYANFFGDHKPARVVVPSGSFFDDISLEIEAIAATKNKI